MFGQWPTEKQIEETAEYAKDKAKIFRGGHEWIFGITVAAFGGALAQIYAHKVLKREKK